MRKTLWSLIPLALALPGCTEPVGAIGVEANELGVTDVRVERSSDDGHQLLVLHALGADGGEIGSVKFTTGRVLYMDEAMHEDWVDNGSELTLAVGDRTWKDISPTLEPHHPNEPKEKELAALVRISAIANALEQDTGISFRVRKHAIEKPYALADCNGVTNLFGTQVNALECCIDFSGSDIYDTVVRPNVYAIAIRTVSYACSEGAYYGPCGGHMQTQASGSWGSIVYWPADGTDWCGYDSEASVDGGLYFPHDYDFYSAAMPSMNGSCDCTQCINGQPRNASGGSCNYYGGY